MPVIINSEEQHPFLPSHNDPTAIEASRALHQDIRPLEIAIVNLMADKPTTERQLAYWLGNTALQVRLTFAATDSYMHGVQGGRETKNTPAEHIRKFYNAWSDIKDRKFDGLIVTGVNALRLRIAEEDIWPEVEAIFDWSNTHVFSSLFLCWGAKAALHHFHDIESYKADQKIFGLFDFRLVSDTTGILAGFPDVFPVPVSRWKSPHRDSIAKCQALEIVAESAESGPDIMVESGMTDRDKLVYPRRVYVLNHPEYDTDTLQREYTRDRSVDSETPMPQHYFPGGDPSHSPINKWRHTAHIYTNWIKAVYEATPYELEAIPETFAQRQCA